MRPVDFEHPPVVETVLGFQFAPIEGWSIPHFGLFWAELQDRYPKFEVQPPTGSEIELRFGRNLEEPSRPTVDLLGSIPVRCWFYDQTQATLIQLQNNCFFHNWRKVGGDQQYLHYDKLRPLFKTGWIAFLKFLEKQKLELPSVWQCEVSYVNHVERKQGWDTFADLPNVLAPWCGKRSDTFLPDPQLVSINSVFPIEGNKGALQILAQPAMRQTDSGEIIQLTLTARGRPSSANLDDLMDWMDLGHEWVVRGFKSFTSTEIHKLWGVK